MLSPAFQTTEEYSTQTRKERELKFPTYGYSNTVREFIKFYFQTTKIHLLDDCKCYLFRIVLVSEFCYFKGLEHWYETK